MIVEGIRVQVHQLESGICGSSPKPIAASEKPRDVAGSRNAPTVLVDGSNVAYIGSGLPKLSTLVRVLETLEEMGLTVLTLVDASLRHHIDEKEKLEDMIRHGRIVQVPARRSADDFLTQLARVIRARGDPVYILSNDVFPETNSLQALPRIACLVVSLRGGEAVIFSPPLTSIVEGASLETTSLVRTSGRG